MARADLTDYMNYQLLQKLQGTLFFTVADLARTAGIQPASARVLATRYAQAGAFVRLKNNMYVAGQKWPSLETPEFFRLANLIQVPSYISFMTALAFYGVTTQVQRDFFESVSIKRSARYQVRGTVFNFYKIKPDYYSGFVKQDGFFIATPEKAFLDAVYLYSAGKYKIDFSSLDLSGLDKKRLKTSLKPFPARTGRIARELCKI